jgi:hypothetical protein
MTVSKKAKPKKGNPSWPTGKPRPLSAIDGKARKAAGLRLGGALSWSGWSLKEARRQGQVEMFPGHHSVGPLEGEVKQAKRRRKRRERQPGVFVS